MGLTWYSFAAVSAISSAHIALLIQKPLARPLRPASAWAADGKGWFVAVQKLHYTSLYYADLAGNAHLLRDETDLSWPCHRRMAGYWRLSNTARPEAAGYSIEIDILTKLIFWLDGQPLSGYDAPGLSHGTAVILAICFVELATIWKHPAAGSMVAHSIRSSLNLAEVSFVDCQWQPGVRLLGN